MPHLPASPNPVAPRVPKAQRAAELIALADRMAKFGTIYRHFPIADQDPVRIRASNGAPVRRSSGGAPMTRSPLMPRLRAHLGGLLLLSVVLLAAEMLVVRVAFGPLFPESSEFRGTLNFAQKQALKERGCTLVGRNVQRLPTQYYCRDPQPGVYPARQLIETLPRTGWVLLDPAYNPSARTPKNSFSQ